MSNIKWKFTDEEVIFVSPANRFDDHVRQYSQKFGHDQNKITILENGNLNQHDLIESSPASDPWEAIVPKDSIVSEDESQAVQLPDVHGNVDEHDPTLDSVVNAGGHDYYSESSDSSAD